MLSKKTFDFLNVNDFYVTFRVEPWVFAEQQIKL